MDSFTALADDVRRALLLRLAAGPGRVVDLAADHPISRPAVSRHLRVLEQAGLVTVEDRGRERHYALDRAGLVPVGQLLADLAGPVHLDPRLLDGLDLEVRRTVRERVHATAPDEETA
ncbi:MAG: ArsR/SmtB family transcription factor [Nocardioides sp.]